MVISETMAQGRRKVRLCFQAEVLGPPVPLAIMGSGLFALEDAGGYVDPSIPSCDQREFPLSLWIPVLLSFIN